METSSRMPDAEVAPEYDHIDRWLDSVRDELPPELDLTVEGIVDRIAGISRRVSKALDETLAEHGLTHADYKVLGSLRWAGDPYRRSAGDLARIADLSSGAMTNRLDQLESAGLVRRLRDPGDRRGVLVEPTEKGRRLWEQAIGVQARKESLIASALDDGEKEQLNDLLRRVMLTLEQSLPDPKKSSG
jgi:DNA-binding MarR family transcriptional regulator